MSTESFKLLPTVEIIKSEFINFRWLAGIIFLLLLLFFFFACCYSLSTYLLVNKLQINVNMVIRAGMGQGESIYLIIHRLNKHVPLKT